MRRLVLLTTCLTLLAAATASAATFTVGLGTDAGDGTCDVPTSCTLRDAIDDANALAGLDEINFAGPLTVTPTSQLPAIEDPVRLNGRDQDGCAGAHENIQIDGANGNYDGLVLGAGSDGSRICTLVVRNFGGVGIVVGSDGNVVDSSRVGTTANGESADGNDLGGISVTGDGNTIGGTVAHVPTAPPPNSGNLISGNAGPGNVVSSGVSVSGTGNTIVGNRIGTDKDGATAVAQEFGVSIGPAAAGTELGDDAVAGAANLISGNTNVGVIADAGSVSGNLIGVTADGTAALGNGIGINVNAAIPVDDNVISGNVTRGVFLAAAATLRGNVIGPSADGESALAVRQPEGIQVQDAGDAAIVGAPGDGNVISGNVEAIETVGVVDDLTIQGNTIGLDDEQEAVVANDNGIKLGGTTTDTQIGGTAANAGNRIAGHTAAVPIAAGIDVGAADGTIIEGNTFGLEADGTLAPNDRAISVGSGGNLTRIGGATTAARNIIAGSSDQGVALGIGSTNTTVQGNHIGVAADGVTAKPNTTGIRIEDSDNAVVGGTGAGQRNVISGNTGAGMFLTGEAVAPVVQGNYIGLGADGTTDVGNGQNGLSMGSSTDAVIGGTTAAARNVISGNGRHGIEVQSGSNAGANIYGNRIGVAADGVTAKPNDEAGVEFSTITHAVILGGTGAGEGNVIAHNGEDGVRVIGPNAFGAEISGNSIHSNGPADADEIGIDLGANVDDGVTPNDPGDADGAADPNHLQNFPVITSAVVDGATTAVGGTIDTTAGEPLRLEFFSSASCDPEGHGQGEVFLGAATMTAGTGATAFSADVGATTAGRNITATATNTDTNETSEFSSCVTATQQPDPPDPDPPDPPDPPVNGGGTGSGSGSGTGSGTGTATPSIQPPPVQLPAPKLPAKMRVRRNGIDDGVLDMLVEITQNAVTPGAELDIAYESSGRTTRFSVPITGRQIKIRKRLPSSQPKDTGITTVTYAGNSAVDPDEVRLRAADGKSQLVRSSSTISGGRLRVNGTISSRARGVVRIRMSFTKPDHATGFLDFRAPIDDGAWALSQALPADAAKGGHLSIQFTGYEPANLRGEQTSKQVP